MKQVSFFYFVLMIGIIIIGCSDIGDNSDILGCMEVSACNYDSKANISNDSCVFTKDCNGECGGIAELDVCGVCGGNIESEENCLECQYAQSLGCDGECSESPIILDECDVCGGDGSDDAGCGCFEAGPSGCDNACGSTLENDACGVCGGDGATCEGNWNVFYDVSIPIKGFEFNIDNVIIINVSGGAAEEANFMITSNTTKVIGFSLSGSAISAGSGILIGVEFEEDKEFACISNLVLSDSEGGSIPATISNCNTIKYSE